MKDTDKPRRGPPKHDVVSYQVQRDIVIPAGTILRAIDGDKFGAPIGFGKSGVAAEFTIKAVPGSLEELAFAQVFRRVVAA